MPRPETQAEWYEFLKDAKDSDISLRRTRLHTGSPDAIASEQIYQERVANKTEEDLQRMIKAKQERESEHTLQVYWRLADWSEKLGMSLFLFGVFMFGYLSAYNHLLSRIITLIRDVTP